MQLTQRNRNVADGFTKPIDYITALQSSAARLLGLPLVTALEASDEDFPASEKSSQQADRAKQHKTANCLPSTITFSIRCNLRTPAFRTSNSYLYAARWWFRFDCGWGGKRNFRRLIALWLVAIRVWLWRIGELVFVMPKCLQLDLAPVFRPISDGQYDSARKNC